MAEDSIHIDIGPQDAEEYGRLLQAVVTDEFGEPIPNVPVNFKIEGNGTLGLSLVVTEETNNTNHDGQAFTIWNEFPRYNPRRALTSVVRASCEVPNCRMKLGEFVRATSGCG